MRSASDEDRFASTFLAVPELTSPTELKRFLARHGLAARKSLGQHWLVSSKVVAKVINACGEPGGILEIGPGVGVLTQRLTDLAPTTAIEIDERCVEALAESAPRATIVPADVLQTDIAAILTQHQHPRVVVSNLPYYITAAVVERLCLAAPSFERAVLMMQKEVADRLAAAPGVAERGSLSVFAQFHFDIETVCVVQPTAFLPQPKVRSQVLLLKAKGRTGPTNFFDFVRAAFKQPRKTLENNLLAAGFPNAQSAIRRLRLGPTVRPHFLTEQQWLALEEELRSPTS